MNVEKIVAIAKRRGFFYPGSEIHGALAGFWHYGPLGATLKRKIENAWRDFFIKGEDFYEIEGTNIMPEKVFIASNHVQSFADPLVQCKKCKSLHRADKLIEDETGIFVPERAPTKKFDKIIKDNKIKCPSCNGDLGNTRYFNMMFKLKVGPTEQAEVAYLRPETCQAIFVDFLNVYRSMRGKLPLGIAQIGRSFRNEISPRRALLRQREFTQAEAEVFFNPNKIDEFSKFDGLKKYELNFQLLKDKRPRKVTVEETINKKLVTNKLIAYYLAKVQQLFNNLGIPLEAIRIREQTEEERPFYAEQGFDCEIKTPLGWVEVVANHYRSNYDLSSHSKVSGQDLTVLEDGKKTLPHVWEISQGIDRTLFCVMVQCFREGKDRGWPWFQFPPSIAPYQVAVFPLVSKDGLSEKAEKICEMLKKHFDLFIDTSGSIGRRYARSDECGCPFVVTVDYQTLKDKSVTLRNRDTAEQIRISIDNLIQTLTDLIEGKIKFTDAGKLVR